MNNGNAAQSKWSQEFHAARGDVSLPCPVEGGCGGTCKQVHPRGIVMLPSGGWKPVPVVEYEYIGVIEHYV